MRTFIHEFASELFHSSSSAGSSRGSHVADQVLDLLRAHLGDDLDKYTLKVLSPQEAAEVLGTCAPAPRAAQASRPVRPELLRGLLVALVLGSGELVRELLRPHVEPDLGGLKAEAVALELLKALPEDHRPDHALVLRDDSGRAVHGIVVDVQLHIDSRKPWLWPVYVTAASSALQCPISLVVIAPDPHVARWARTPSKSGVRSFVKPVVVSYRDVPRIISAETARQLPELGVLSALAHPSAEVVRAAAAGLVSLGETARGRIYREGLRQLLPARLLVEMEVACAAAAGSERGEKEPAAQEQARGGGERADEVVDDDEESDDDEDDFDFDEFLAEHFARLRQREPLERYLKKLAKRRIGALSRDDEMAVGMASGRDESAVQLVFGLAEAKTTEEAREAIHEAAIFRIDAVRDAERKR